MMHRLIKKINNLIVTLRFSILSIFITLFIITTLLIMIMTSIRYTRSVSYVATELMKYASASVLYELSANMKPAAIESQFAANLLEKGVLGDHETELVPFTADLVKILPLGLGAYWGNQYGDFISAKKQSDGSITTEVYKRSTPPATRVTILRDKYGKIIKQFTNEDMSYDPRVRPWYLQAQKEKKTIWTDIYFFKPNPDLGITTASPVYKDGKFYGAFGIDIDLNYLSKFVKNLHITKNGYSFIITKKGRLIAYPDIEPFLSITPSDYNFININNDTLPLIYQTLAEFNKSKQKELTFSYAFGGETYMVTYEPIKSLEKYEWLVGVIAPRSDFTSDLEKMNLLTFSACLFILIGGILLVSSLITRMMKPIKLLVTETENIKHFNLDGEIPIKSRIKEIIYLREAIHSMKKGLKLFQRYIPKILVKQLIDSGEDIRVGGVKKELAILFSDIENFTTIAEKTKPNDLIMQMSEYLEELTHIIIEEKGTIDKYIGDSIMAFWGSPLPDNYPCHNAANAALYCQLKLNELNAHWKKQGKSALLTRIGIHTGDAIVGNLGSSERLNYTAIGDNINVASRLEEINKNYKTHIIVSDAVYEKIKDKFVLRMLDCVIVKGRTKSSYIYELLSDDIEKVAFDIRKYNPLFNKGFKTYQHRHWDEAIELFKQCLQIYPDDTIAPIFIERCERFKNNPPASNWKGIME